MDVFFDFFLWNFSYFIHTLVETKFNTLKEFEHWNKMYFFDLVWNHLLHLCFSLFTCALVYYFCSMYQWSFFHMFFLNVTSFHLLNRDRITFLKISQVAYGIVVIFIIIFSSKINFYFSFSFHFSRSSLNWWLNYKQTFFYVCMYRCHIWRI